MPRVGDVPGAIEAGAPEFLDFLISQSANDRQALYRDGLDALNNATKKRFSKTFADEMLTEAAPLLAPLRQQWTYDPPADPLARFLWAAKQDVRTATVNSREYTIAAAVAEAGEAPGLVFTGIRSTRVRNSWLQKPTTFSSLGQALRAAWPRTRSRRKA